MRTSIHTIDHGQHPAVPVQGGSSSQGRRSSSSVGTYAGMHEQTALQCAANSLDKFARRLQPQMQMQKAAGHGQQLPASGRFPLAAAGPTKHAWRLAGSHHSPGGHQLDDVKDDDADGAGNPACRASSSSMDGQRKGRAPCLLSGEGEQR